MKTYFASNVSVFVSKDSRDFVIKVEKNCEGVGSILSLFFYRVCENVDKVPRIIVRI